MNPSKKNEVLPRALYPAVTAWPPSCACCQRRFARPARLWHGRHLPVPRQCQATAPAQLDGVSPPRRRPAHGLALGRRRRTLWGRPAKRAVDFTRSPSRKTVSAALTLPNRPSLWLGQIKLGYWRSRPLSATASCAVVPAGTCSASRVCRSGSAYTTSTAMRAGCCQSSPYSRSASRIKQSTSVPEIWLNTGPMIFPESCWRIRSSAGIQSCSQYRPAG